jgi:hypothetical protein
MILKVMIGLAALLSTILVVAATKPKTFRIQRSTSIDAPPESVFVLIDDHHNWARWAPQDKEDASMKGTYNGSEHRQVLSGFRSRATRLLARPPVLRISLNDTARALIRSLEWAMSKSGFR